MKSIDKMTLRELRQEKQRLICELLEMNRKNAEMRREREEEIEHATGSLHMKMASHLASVGQPSGVLRDELNELRKQIPMLVRNPTARALMVKVGDYDDFREDMREAELWDPPVPPGRRRLYRLWDATEAIREKKKNGQVLNES